MDHLQMCRGSGESEGAGGRGGPLQMEIGWKGSGQTSGERTLYTSVAPSPLSHDGSARNLQMELMEMFDMDHTLSGLHQRGRTKAYES